MGDGILTYQEIGHRSGFFIDTVIVGVEELVDNGKAIKVQSATTEPSFLRAMRL